MDLNVLQYVRVLISGDVWEIWAVFYVWGCMALFRVYALAVMIARARDESSEGSQCRP